MTRDGVFLPDGRALCVTCHNAIPEPRPSWWRRLVPRTAAQIAADPDGATAPCPRCGKPAAFREDVADLLRVRADVGGDLQQTGGMCVALVLEEAGHAVVVTVGDEAGDEGRYGVGLYSASGWSGEDGSPEPEEYESVPREDLAATVHNMVVSARRCASHLKEGV